MHHEIYCIGRHNSTMKLLLGGAKKVTPPVIHSLKCYHKRKIIQLLEFDYQRVNSLDLLEFMKYFEDQHEYVMK